MKKVVSFSFISLATFLLAMSANASKVVHCRIDKSIPGPTDFKTTLCGEVDFAYPNNTVKGSIEPKKNIGSCPEIAMVMARTFPSIRAIMVVLGEVDQNYGPSLGFTEQTGSVIFYDSVPKRFALDSLEHIGGEKRTYRADCSVTKK